MRSYNSKLFQMQKTYGESANILPKDVKFVHQFFVSRKKATTDAEMQLTVGPVGPRGQNFRGSGKWRLCVRPNDRQTFLLLGPVKNQISVGPGYLLDP